MRFNPKSASPKTFFAEITPVEAAQILQDYNADNYRRLSPATAKRYENEMRKRDWVDCVSTVDFDTTPQLLNGQHTLMACINVGRPITVTVRTGLATQAKLVLDAGKPRTEADAMQESAAFVSVGRWMFDPSESPKIPGRTKMIEFYEKHRDAITFALDACPRGSIKGIRIGPVLAPVARASYSQDLSEHPVLGSAEGVQVRQHRPPAS